MAIRYIIGRATRLQGEFFCSSKIRAQGEHDTSWRASMIPWGFSSSPRASTTQSTKVKLCISKMSLFTSFAEPLGLQEEPLRILCWATRTPGWASSNLCWATGTPGNVSTTLKRALDSLANFHTSRLSLNGSGVSLCDSRVSLTTAWDWTV